MFLQRLHGFLLGERITKKEDAELQKFRQTLILHSTHPLITNQYNWLLSPNQSIEIFSREIFGEKTGFWCCSKTFISERDFNLAKEILPQITYHCPLKDISAIFNRLRELDHKTVKNFLNTSIDDKVLDTRINKSKFKITELENKIRVEANEEKRGIFARESRGEKEKLSQHVFQKKRIIDVINQNDSEDLKGFMYLFSFYVFQLFNDNIDVPSQEPSPKSVLPIMSRLPFSTMYQDLEPEEKNRFQNFVVTHFQDTLPKKIRRYKKYDGDFIEEINRITLQEWFDSIVVPRQRVIGGERFNNDLLSPPSLDSVCSMGTFNIQNRAQKHALIEARGYSRLKINGQNMTIDNVAKFVKSESEFFFNKFNQN